VSNKAFTALLCGFLIVAGIFCYLTYNPAEPITSVAEWHRSDELPPPDDKPICGMWLDDGQPVVEFVRKAGENFYEYNPNPFAPTALLWAYPPVYWSEMPGAAE